MDINTCYETTNTFHTIAYYTHLVPLIVSFFLSIYLLFKTRFSLLSKVFFGFILGINIWLIADLIAWTQQDYNLIQFFWSFFDYANTIFFIFGLYFFSVLVRQKDIDWRWKLLGLVLIVPAFARIITGNSIHEFDQTVCESYNDDFLVAYKNYVEIFVIIGIIVITSYVWIKEKNKNIRNQVSFVALGLLLFFATFAATDYVGTNLGEYEIGLYGLFVLPIFLGLIVYSIVKYKAFNVGVLGAQALVITLAALVGSQFFFIHSLTNQILNSITFLLAVVFGYFLVRGVKKDLETRKQLEKLADNLQHANARLKELDAQKTEFISLATHQIRGPLGSIKGYASMVLEGDYGPLPEMAKKAVEVMMKSAQSLVVVVGDYLDVSRIEQGKMKFDFSDFDMKDLVETVVKETKPVIEASKLAMTFDCDMSQKYKVNADMGKIKQVVGNLVDNSIKYTPTGSINVTLTKSESSKPAKILVSIKDTGVGIKKEVMPLLFNKFSRAPDAGKTNIAGTGLGLFVAKKIIEAHNGRVWAESEGEGKGSQFYVELVG